MNSLLDLLFSYAMIGAGFVLFGALSYGWLFPDRLGGASVTGLLAASFVLGLVGGVLIVLGLNWHRAATDEGSLRGPRER